MKINLRWGGGGFDVLLDLRTGHLMAYSSEVAAAEVHSRFGGKNYYRSRSGMSGAGWVTGNMALRKVETYRVDTAYVYAPDIASISAIVPGLGTVIVPIDYGRAEIPREWPIAVVRGAQRVYYGTEESCEYDSLHLLDPWGISRLLEGSEFEETEFSIRYLPSTSQWAEMAERKFPVRIQEGTHLAYRRALIGLFNSELALKLAEGEEKKINPFWNRLGLWQIGGQIYKIVQNVARMRYTQEELSTVEALQATAPQNVLVLSPTLYIQEGWDGFDAVGHFEFDGEEEVEFELRLEAAEAVRAMRGDFAGVLARLEEGALGKHEQDLSFRRHQEELGIKWEERGRHLQELCEQHPELEVATEDSVTAGNCRVGTENFLRQHFGGREILRVRELVPHLANPGVRRVLEHKLLPLTEASADEAQGGEE